MFNKYSMTGLLGNGSNHNLQGTRNYPKYISMFAYSHFYVSLSLDYCL